MTDEIMTSAEHAENAVLPRLREVHLDPGCGTGACEEDLPAELRAPAGSKSPARWAYERVLLYIRNFEQQLGAGQEVAMGFVGGDAGVLRIEGIGYFDPDIVTFYGTDEAGLRTQLIQHVAQLNVMLRAMPAARADEPARRIGFRLDRELAGDGMIGAGAASDPASALS